MDLSLVPLDDMIAEIKKRFDAFIFHAVKRTRKHEDSFITRWEGGQPACRGLCNLMMRRLDERLEADEKDKGLQDHTKI